MTVQYGRTVCVSSGIIMSTVCFDGIVLDIGVVDCIKTGRHDTLTTLRTVPFEMLAIGKESNVGPSFVILRFGIITMTELSVS